MASAKTATLAGFGLAGVALGTALTLTLTTLTATTGNITTVNSTTVTTTQLNVTTGSVSTLDVTGPALGTGATRFTGGGGTGTGSQLCKQDTDGLGYTVEACLNGTCANRVAQADECL
jgi:hypothetical protein